MTADRANRLAVAICGAGHSGSTLLGLVLGSHPELFYAGEAKKTLFIGDGAQPLRKRVCKLCGPDCPVWGRFSSPPQPDLYEHLSRITGRPGIVDSTKRPDWIRARARELSEAGVAQKRIFLTRDGRAVVNSRVRKYPDESPEEIVEGWRAQMREAERLVGEAGPDGMKLHYEELASSPEATVRRVCAFLGLEYDPTMLEYERREHHPLGGNTGTQSVVARATEREGVFASIPERSRRYYEGIQGGFRLDLRWRSELPEPVWRLFEERAGVDNRPYEWETADP